MSGRGAVTYIAGVAALVLCASAPATADTIYLKNGRVIHTERARVQDGRLVFSQHGGTVSIPMDTVDHVESDAKIEATSAAPPDAGPAPVAGSAAATGSATPTTPKATAAYAWDGVEYWAERLIEIDRRIERVENELDRLPAYSEIDQQLIVSGQIMYFVAERAKWEGFRTRLIHLRDGLERSARKAGIAPGALRKARQR